MPISKPGVLLIIGILAAVAAGMAYFSSETSFGGKITDSFKHPTGLLTKVGFGGKEYATIEFVADVTLSQAPALELSFSQPIESFSFSFNSMNQKLSLGDLQLSSTGNSNVDLKGYKGSVSIKDVVSFGGKTSAFHYNTIFNTGQDELKVSATDVPYTKLVLAGVPKTTFSFSSVTGTLTGKAEDEEFTIKITGKPLHLNDFQGKVSIEGTKLRLEGVAAIKTSLLQTN